MNAILRDVIRPPVGPNSSAGQLEQLPHVSRFATPRTLLTLIKDESFTIVWRVPALRLRSGHFYDSSAKAQRLQTRPYAARSVAGKLVRVHRPPIAPSRAAPRRLPHARDDSGESRVPRIDGRCRLAEAERARGGHWSDD